jgi:prepilin-type N-terminal cleavage/methylation domain-containing protein
MPRHAMPTGRQAFTLVELLVVISIIGLLSSIAVVSMNGSRDKARIAAGQSFEQSVYQKLGDKLEGEWKFETIGATTPDTSGMNRTGTVGGTVTQAAGFLGNAFSSTAAGYVNVGTMDISNAVTVGAWIKPAVAGHLGFIVGKEPVNMQWELFLEAGYLRWRGGDPSSNNASCPEPTPNAWHYVVGTQYGNQAAIYIDGKKCVTATITPIGNGSGAVEIGTFGPGSYNFYGSLDEVRVYSGSLLE